MIKNNKSKFEVRSSSQGYMVPPRARIEDPSTQGRRRGSSFGTSTKLNANKYSIRDANHTIIDHNYIYNVYKYTIHDHDYTSHNSYHESNDHTSINGHESSRKIGEAKGLNGGGIFDDDGSRTHHPIAVYGIGSIGLNRKVNNYNSLQTNCANSRDREGKCDNGSDRKESGDEEEDTFTFSSVAGSMEFFTYNSSTCTSDAEAASCMHGRPSMSPADELFQDGKIRPLIQPIITGHDRSIPPISNNLHSKPMNAFKPSSDQPTSLNQFAAQYLAASTDHCVIKQELRTEKRDNPADYLRQGALNHGLSCKNNDKSFRQGKLDQGLSTEIDQKVLNHSELRCGLSREIDQKSELDHELSTEIDQKLKQMHDDQLELKAPKHGEWPLQVVSLSAPTSPMKKILANERNDNHARSHPFYSVVSQVSYYKRSKSLSRVSQVEDNELILEVQDLVEDGTKGLNYKRNTLQDLLTPKGNPINKSPHHEMVKEPYEMKQLGLASPYRNAKNFYDAKIRPSLAPTPINIPLLWQVRHKKCAPPTTNGKSSKAPSPHKLHYSYHKAQAHGLKKKTFLPYRPSLFGCLGYPPQ